MSGVNLLHSLTQEGIVSPHKGQTGQHASAGLARKAHQIVVDEWRGEPSLVQGLTSTCPGGQMRPDGAKRGKGAQEGEERENEQAAQGEAGPAPFSGFTPMLCCCWCCGDVIALPTCGWPCDTGTEHREREAAGSFRWQADRHGNLKWSMRFEAPAKARGRLHGREGGVHNNPGRRRTGGRGAPSEGCSLEHPPAVAPRALWRRPYGAA